MSPLVDNKKLNNVFGPLSGDVKQRLQDVLADPTKNWDAAYSIILRADRKHITLWQAVIAVDPTFPREKRESWTRLPDQLLIGRALRYAARL